MTPYIEDNELVIPIDSDPKYHYWNSGQKLIETLGELDAPASLFDKHAHHFEPTGETCKCGKPAKSTSQAFYCAVCGAWWEKG